MKQVDYVHKKFSSQKRRHLLEALSQKIARQFPRLGGPRIRHLCSEMILEVVNAHLRPRDSLSHGQILWVAVDKDDAPSSHQRHRPSQLVSVVLDLVTPDDIDDILARLSLPERRQKRCVRLCRQAYDQGGLLSNADLSLMLGISDPAISNLLITFEKAHGLVPRRATLHDCGSGLTHKEQICRLYFHKGLQADEVARATFHSQQAVDRYLAQFQRIRDCRNMDLSPHEIAYTVGCSLGLVHQYLKIDDQINSKEND